MAIPVGSAMNAPPLEAIPIDARCLPTMKTLAAGVKK